MLHTDLQQLRADERRHAKLTHDLEGIARQSKIAERRVEALAAEIEKEGRDVRRLEGFSLSSIYLHLFGDHTEQLRAEQRELLAAQVRYDEQLKSLTALESDAGRIRAEIDSLGDLAARRNSLLARRAEELHSQGGAPGQELDALDARRAELTADLREIEEALEAGGNALSSLDRAVSQLGDARSWGGIDMMGGGTFTTLIKHSKLDDAHRSLGSAQRLLQRFARELEDVGRTNTNLEVEIGAGTRFMDLFFDNLIVDWIVQSRIVESADRVRETRRDVREVLRDLERRRSTLRANLERIDAERRQLLDADG